MKEEVKRLNDRVRQAAGQAVARTAARLAREAAVATPVETGRLRGSWQITKTPGKAWPLDPAPPGVVYPPPQIQTPKPALRLYVVNPTPYAADVELGRLGRPGAQMALVALGRLAGELSKELVKELG